MSAGTPAAPPQPSGKSDAGYSGYSSGQSLREMRPEEISQMSPQQVREAAKSTTWNDLAPEQKDAIMRNGDLRQAALEGYQSRSSAQEIADDQLDPKEREERDRIRDLQKAAKDAETDASTSFMTNLGAAAGKMEQPVSAVQVRVSNTDKPQ
jgi:hypothetical protein